MEVGSREETTMPKRTILTSWSMMASVCATASIAMAQTPAPPTVTVPSGLFPEVKGAPPPPGTPTMEEMLAAYLGNRTAAPAAAAPARPATPPPGRTLPPIKTIGPVPNPDHIQFTLPDDIPWKGREGQNQTWNIFGSPTEPGPYLQLMKWWPGAYSGPHMHPNTRYALVVSGTWWTSSSPVQDKTQTYPLPAGTYVVEPPYTYHWDGARNEPAVLMLWGNGPSPNIAVDEKGLPRIGQRGGAAPVAAPARAAPRPGGDD
jgi:quercetin dioxygenase-like cupin family protein